MWELAIPGLVAIGKAVYDTIKGNSQLAQLKKIMAARPASQTQASQGQAPAPSMSPALPPEQPVSMGPGAGAGPAPMPGMPTPQVVTPQAVGQAGQPMSSVGSPVQGLTPALGPTGAAPAQPPRNPWEQYLGYGMGG